MYQNYFQEEINCRLKLGRCLPSFDASIFVFEFAIQKFKDKDTHNYNFACCFVWV